MASRVKKAKKLSAADLASALEPHTRSDALLLDAPTSLRFGVVTAAQLSDSQRSCVWDLFQQNMQDIYISSGYPWDPEEKKKELFDRLSRFILVSSDACNTPEDQTLGAYAMFRFDMEEREAVLYCYEIQVGPAMRRRGIGKHLMDILDVLGKHTFMKKVMLTVQTANTSAMSFYTSIGFAIDPTSPGYVGTSPDEVDGWVDEGEDTPYVILSKYIT